MKKKKFKQWQKDLILWGVVLSIIGGIVTWYLLTPKLGDIDAKPVPEDEIVEVLPVGGATMEFGGKNYILGMKNDSIEFYISTDNTMLYNSDFIVVDRKSGIKWFSNPVDEDDPTASFGEVYNSQLSVSYITDSDKAAERNTYNHASFRMINKESEDIPDQVEFTPTEDGKGIRVIYKLGAMWQDFVTPCVMTPEQYDELINNPALDKSAVARIKTGYRLHKAGKDMATVSTTKQKNYPIIGQADVYVLETEIDIARAQPAYALKNLGKVFIDAGWTLEDVKKNHKDLNVQVGFSDVIRLYMDYRLEGDSLTVTIPTKDIWLQPKLQYRLSRLDLLKYFGAGSYKDNGYIFIPDRSGALVTFNKGKRTQSELKVPIYGWDKGVLLEMYNPSESYGYFPVFGIKRNDGAMFAMIEEGAEIATIAANASTPGNQSTMNYVYPTFTLMAQASASIRQSQNEKVNLLNLQSVQTYQNQRYEGDIKVRYSFLSGSDANFNGMAKEYRQYLEENGIITRNTEVRDIPFVADFLGSIDTKKSVAGIPRNVDLPLTTFDQAQELMQKLLDGNVKNLSVRYKGWANGGLFSSYFDKAKPMGVLGGQSGFKDLVEYSDKNGIALYPEAEFLYNYKNTMFDSFKIYKHASRSLTSSVAYKYYYSPVTGEYVDKDRSAIIVKPTMFMEQIASFMKGYDKFDLKALAPTSMGNQLNSDFNEKSSVRRGVVMDHLTESAQSMIDNGYKLMLGGSSEYMLKYATILVDAPVNSTGYFAADRQVPFFQMVLHGYIDYVPAPINQGDDIRYSFLKSVEMGSGISYVWMYADNFIMKDVSYDKGYSLNYQQWIDGAINYYERANEALKGLTNKLMVDHYAPYEGKEFYVTVYEDGTKVIVNYTDVSVTYQGVQVAPVDFAVVR